jgi:UDP-N-acetylmuramoyl-L-alanyl-D-glutamate--2,6-diaminopimelate ligase
MELRDVFATLDASRVIGDGRGVVEDLAVDARRVRRGSVFFCVRGFGVDGHDWPRPSSSSMATPSCRSEARGRARRRR